MEERPTYQDPNINHALEDQVVEDQVKDQAALVVEEIRLSDQDSPTETRLAADKLSETEQNDERNSLRQSTTIAATSHVNGQGLWRSWQRSFRRPLDAMLDLVDNAVDANHGEGRIRISLTSPTPDDQGIFMVNSFNRTAYKEMHLVLEVFSSQKEQEAIGENGVGIKQASASLSDFSIVVTKNCTRFQVGFLCACLQRPEGIHIPSFTLEGDLEAEADKLCESDSVFAECMEYLGGRPGSVNSDVCSDEHRAAFRNSGRIRLLELMSHMSDFPDWKEHDCVFALLLDQMRIKQSTDSVVSVLHELKETLPQTYLHLQAHKCDISILNEPLRFQYWERRLVELTYFPINVSPNVSFLKEKAEDVASPKTFNQLRVFIGFDPVRCADEERTSCASFFIYSRECGRLVKHLSDCRSELGLSAGGTVFCQGLTVILDDYESSLPLTPTKQDIAWSDGAHGDIHRTNVYGWVRAVINLYYNYYISQFDTKTKLSSVLKREVSYVEMLREATVFISPLANTGLFNSFTGVQWIRHGTGRIVVKNRSAVEVKSGEATLLPFRGSRTTAKEAEPDPTKKRRQSAAKTMAVESPYFASSTTDETSEPRKRGRPPKRAADESVEAEFTVLNDELPKRSARKSRLTSPEKSPEDETLEILMSEEAASSRRSSRKSPRKAIPKKKSPKSAPRDSLGQVGAQKAVVAASRKRLRAGKMKLVDPSVDRSSVDSDGEVADDVESEEQPLSKATGASTSRKPTARIRASKQKLVESGDYVEDEPRLDGQHLENSSPSNRKLSSRIRASKQKLATSSGGESDVEGDVEVTGELWLDEQPLEETVGTPNKRKQHSRIRASKQKLATSSGGESAFDDDAEVTSELWLNEKPLEKTAGTADKRKPYSRIRASKQKLVDLSATELVAGTDADDADETEDQLLEKARKIEQLEESNSLLRNEIQKVKEFSNAELEKLRHRIKCLEIENQSMKEELERKNGKLLARDEHVV